MIFFLSAVALWASASAPLQASTYASIREKILLPKCVSCHGASHAARGLDLSTDAGVLSVVQPFAANQSLLYQVVSSKEGDRMPLMQEALSKKELRDIKVWIDAGAHVD